MNTTLRAFAAVFAAALMTVATVPAEAQGRQFNGYHGHRGGYSGWGGPTINLGIGVGLGSYYGGYWGPYYPSYYPYYPGYVIVEGTPTTTYVKPAPAEPAAKSSAPEPVIYPRNGQTQAQTDSDRLECNHWASTQQGALNDSSIFQRAVAACLDGRGYTVR